jgi:hypothetical protein
MKAEDLSTNRWGRFDRGFTPIEPELLAWSRSFVFLVDKVKIIHIVRNI